MSNKIVNIKKGNNLIQSGAYRYLRYSSHKCANCILARKGKCHIYGKTIERNGVKIDVNQDTNCPILADHVDEFVSEIMALDHIKPSDIHAINQAARYLGFLFIANAYLGEQGTFIIDGHQLSTKSLHDSIMKVEASLSRALETLGLTPQSRRKLRLSKKDRKTIADYILESEDEAK